MVSLEDRKGWIRPEADVQTPGRLLTGDKFVETDPARQRDADHGDADIGSHASACCHWTRAQEAAAQPVPLSAAESCRDAELRRIARYWHTLPSVIVRLPGQQEALLLGQLLAHFSPDCAHFPFETNHGVTVTEVASGSSSPAIEGRYGTWLSDSTGFVLNRGRLSELVLVSLRGRRAEVLFRPDDAAPCAAEYLGTGIDGRHPSSKEIP
jgi:hypothetical protein